MDLVGFNADNGRKILFSCAFLGVVWLTGRLLKWMTHGSTGSHDRRAFWTRQAISIAVTLINILGLLSIWFDDPTRLATALGLVTAGLAFALQRVVTAIAGYILILRGKTFNVGDRITFGGIRGDVIGLGFLQTVIMEMGQPRLCKTQTLPCGCRDGSSAAALSPSRMPRSSTIRCSINTRDFPFIWEEIRIPVSYTADRKRAEQVMLAAANRHTRNAIQLSEEALQSLERRYYVTQSELDPRVYLRLTDNWVELALRFVVPDHGVREIKDHISRDILAGFEEAGIGIASSTYDVVGMPTVRVQMMP